LLCFDFGLEGAALFAAFAKGAGFEVASRSISGLFFLILGSALELVGAEKHP
jgi:hypothetical protein